MRKVKSKNTKPELYVRRLLHRLGYRYRLHGKDLPGAPDLVFTSRRKVIFVHGCFWHGHDCKRGSRSPAQNADYWRAKIARNVERHRFVEAELALLKWRSMAAWECELRDPSLAARLQAFLDDA